MTMTVLARTVLFVSSYAPLLFLFALLESFGDGWASRVCVLVGAVSIVALGLIWWLLGSKLQPEQDDFEGARSRDSDVMAYVVSYVVPFAAVTDQNGEATRLALAMFAGLIAVLYIRSAVYYVHPLLLLVGLHVYEASRQGVPVVVLSRQRYLRQACTLRVINIGPNVYVEKPA
jgi:hypothetical protein